MLDVTLLGCGGMLPMKERWLTSCLISCQGHSILIDCGEGTQIALKYAEKKTKPVDLICITHFHADHISGLTGFLLSMGNEGRTDPVVIAGPPGIEKTVKCLLVIAPNLPFEVICKEVTPSIPFQSGLLTVTPFEAKHSLRCFGYSVELNRKAKFSTEKAKSNSVPMCIWSQLQKDGEVSYDGKKYFYSDVSEGKRKGLKVTYCTDSRPADTISQFAKGSDLFICEGLYYDPEKFDRALKTKHMMFEEAARLAKNAEVSRLWLTHFSPAVQTPEEGLEFAKKIFPPSECGYDGRNIVLTFDDDE